MTKIVLTERTPEAMRGYAAGIRMAAEIFEFDWNTMPLLGRLFPRRVIRDRIAGLRLSADLIEKDADAVCPPQAPTG